MSDSKLSILICRKPEREHFFERLMGILEEQETHETEVIWSLNDFGSIGAKRNHLMDKSTGEYLCFIDDDDRVSANYIQLLMEGINKGVDCCSLKGIITEDGQNPLIFEHSIKYGIYRTVTDSLPGDVRYERYPNHLNCIRSDIAKQFRFPEKNHGEDTDWATLVHESGLIKTEHYIPEVIYHYEYIRKK